MKAVRLIKRFKFPPMDSRFFDGFINTKKRGIKEIPSSEKIGTPLSILVAEGDTEEEEERSLTCVSHGLISVIGRRRAMEDAVTVAIGEIDSYDFFAVYDGHGGSKVANACRERMHQLVAKAVEEWTSGEEGLVDWEKVMAVCFEKIDEEVSSGDGGGAEVGSTAVVVMVGMKEVVVANCGDSRAVLCRAGVAVPLSRDHKVTCKFFMCIYYYYGKCFCSSWVRGRRREKDIKKSYK